MPHTFVIPAKAGIQLLSHRRKPDTRFCGHGGWWRVALAALLALLAIPALAQNVPKLTSRFVDTAGLLQPEQRAALEQKLADIERDTGRQVFVATIADMQGYPLEMYGIKLLRTWAPGTKEKDDGLVMFIAPNEPAGQRGPRIEVGYGLEPIITDAFASLVANSIMTPMLRQGDIAGALNAGVDTIGTQLKLTPEEAAKRAAELAAQQAKDSDSVDPGAFIFWVLVLLFVILPMVGGLLGGGRRGRRHRSGLGEALLWTAINVAANSGRDNDGGGWGGGGGWSGGGGFGGGGGGSGGGGGASGGW
jgi:uncharacterized protein